MKEQLNQLVVIVIVVSFLIAGCSSSAASVPPTQPPAEMHKGPRAEWHLEQVPIECTQPLRYNGQHESFFPRSTRSNYCSAGCSRHDA
jgi:hypothetical protein